MPEPGTPQKNPHRTLVVFRCQTTLADALKTKAARCQTSVSAVIRELLKAGLLKSL